MILSNQTFMANPENGCRQETHGGINRVRAFMTSLAAAGLLLGGCDSSAKEANKADLDKAKEIQIAEAEEARAFGSLPEQLQNQIRTEMLNCMAEVKEFADEEPNEKFKNIALDSGESHCDEMRGLDIRKAIADQGIEDLTKKITSG